MPRLAPELIEAFVLAELDRAGLGHNTFTLEALALEVEAEAESAVEGAVGA